MTASAQQKIFNLFTEHQLPEEVYYSVLRIVNEDNADSDKANCEMNRLYNEMKQKYENNQRAYKDAHERFNSKLMSVYYLLDMVSSAGTHGEKRNVINGEPDEIFYVVITWIQEWCMFGSLIAKSEYQDYINNGVKALDEPLFWTYTLEDTDSRKHFLCGNIYEHKHLLK